MSAPALAIRFTRLSPTHHRLEILHRDGKRECAELETRSFLHHDLLHFAVESEACLVNSFFGGLAAGKTYAELSRRGAPLTGEILTTERIVGALMPVVRGKADPASFRAGLVNLYEALGEPVPAFVTDDFVAAVAARYRALLGRWEATPFGREMELKFEV